MWICDTQVLTIAVIHAARTNSLDLNAYFPACQSLLNAATEQLQVRFRMPCCWCCAAEAAGRCSDDQSDL